MEEETSNIIEKCNYCDKNPCECPWCSNCDDFKEFCKCAWNGN